MKDDERNQVKSLMWHFLEMGGQEANIPALKDAVMKLCQAVVGAIIVVFTLK